MRSVTEEAPMKAYLIVTGSIFALLGIAHLFRLFVEGGHPLLADPWFLASNLVIFVVGFGVGTWAFLLLRHVNRQPAI